MRTPTKPDGYPACRAAAFALALGALAGCSESPTDPADVHDMVAEITGEREKTFWGNAEVGLENGFFYIRGEGTGIFEDHSMELTATSEGEPEVGTYTVGLPGEEDEPDFRATWRMEIALFTATEGTLTITLSTDHTMEGEFSFTAERTHVCNSLESCQALDGDLEEGEVEGSFRVERDPPDEG